MHRMTIDKWEHSHSFGMEERKTGESRTLAVAVLTAAAMVVEIVAGFVFGSMALLADGLHMASHAVALAIAALVYMYARRRADDARFCFGTGKANALGGYTSALLLTMFSVIMVWESVARLLAPIPIAIDQAIVVAVLGLLVNGVSMFILHPPNGGHHGHGHDDFNLRGAFLHVLADVLTSVLAIAALLAAKFAGVVWMDPAMGIIGALLIIWWAWGLTKQSGSVLLDRQAPWKLRDSIRGEIESFRDTRIVDLHVWSVGPGIYAAEIALVSHDPAPPDIYKQLISALGLVHVIVEVHRCPGQECA